MAPKKQASLLDMFGIKKRREGPAACAFDNDPLGGTDGTPAAKRRKKAGSGGLTPKSKTPSSTVQLTLDAGQKDIGCTTCTRCGMVYTPGTEDDRVHRKHCRAATSSCARSTTANDSVVRCGSRWWTDDDVVAGDIITKVVRCGAEDTFREKMADALCRYAGQALSFGEHTLYVAVDATDAVLAGASVERLAVGDAPEGVLVGISCVVVRATTPSEVVELLLEGVRSSAIHGYTLEPSQVAVRRDVDIGALAANGGDVAPMPAAVYG